MEPETEVTIEGVTRGDLVTSDNVAGLNGDDWRQSKASPHNTSTGLPECHVPFTRVFRGAYQVTGRFSV